MTEIERFWSKTKVDGSCIVWTAGVGSHGYGMFEVRDPTTKRHGGWRAITAHRYILQRIMGPIPRTIDVMHSCDNRRCVKLQHLSPGSRKMNLQDAAMKDRMPFGVAKRNAKLTNDKVVEIRTRYAAGESRDVLGAAFGVHPVHVSSICRGKVWRRAGGPIAQPQPRSKRKV
jgi:hypothetical protein